jgi:arsenate reductase
LLRAELLRLRHARMITPENKLRVLILCTGNSARSQMAEGLLRQVGGTRYEVFSAGTKPVSVNSLAIEVMREKGIDISKQRSKSVAEFAGQKFAMVITVCDNAAEECAVFPGAPQRVHWSLTDPAAVSGTREEKLGAFRKVRDDLERRIQSFVNQG